MKKSILFAVGVLFAVAVAAAPPVRSITEITPANADAFRAWAKSAPMGERQAFLDELKGLPRTQKQRVLRTLFPVLRTRQIQGSHAASNLGDMFSIQYDVWPNTGVTFLGLFGGFMGNQFDTGLPVGTNTVNTVQFLALASPQASGVVGFFGPVSAGQAPFLGSANVGPIGGPPTLISAVLPTPVTGLTGSFQGGLLQAPPVPNVAGGLGLAYLGISGYAYGQAAPRGGIQGPDSLHLMFVLPGGTHSAIADSTFRNGIFRVSGVTIPVELTNFSVE